jgi:hypothetical protein
MRIDTIIIGVQGELNSINNSYSHLDIYSFFFLYSKGREPIRLSDVAKVT